MRRRGGERTGTLTRRGDHDRKRKGGKEEQREREREERDEKGSQSTGKNERCVFTCVCDDDSCVSLSRYEGEGKNERDRTERSGE